MGIVEKGRVAMKEKLRTSIVKFRDKFIDFDEMLHEKLGKMYNVDVECDLYKQYSIPYMRNCTGYKTNYVIKAFNFYEAHNKALALAYGDPLVEKARVINCIRLRKQS